MDEFVLVHVHFGLFKSSASESVSSACHLGGANLSLCSLLLCEILSGLGCGDEDLELFSKDEDSDILLSGGSEVQAVVSTTVVMVSLSPSSLFFFCSRY